MSSHKKATNYLLMKFRPSSHSEDGTVVATFENDDDAKQAINKVRRYGGTKWRNKVMVSGCSLDHNALWNTERIFRECRAKEIKKPERHQELIITVSLPAKATLKTIPLLLDPAVAQTITALTRTCGKPHETIKGNTRILTFSYCKDKKIYYPFKHPNAPHGLLRLEQRDFVVPEKFKIRGLI